MHPIALLKYTLTQPCKCKKNLCLLNIGTFLREMVLLRDSTHSRRILFNKIKAKWSRYRPGVAQRVGRSIALVFHDRGTRREWVVSSTPRPHFIPGKEPVPILQEAGWAPGPVWMGGNSRPHQDSIPDSPARSQSQYQMSYRTHRFLSSTIIKLELKL